MPSIFNDVGGDASFFAHSGSEVFAFDGPFPIRVRTLGCQPALTIPSIKKAGCEMGAVLRPYCGVHCDGVRQRAAVTENPLALQAPLAVNDIIARLRMPASEGMTAPPAAIENMA